MVTTFHQTRQGQQPGRRDLLYWRSAAKRRLTLLLCPDRHFPPRCSTIAGSWEWLFPPPHCVCIMSWFWHLITILIKSPRTWHPNGHVEGHVSGYSLTTSVVGEDVSWVDRALKHRNLNSIFKKVLCFMSRSSFYFVCLKNYFTDASWIWFKWFELKVDLLEPKNDAQIIPKIGNPPNMSTFDFEFILELEDKLHLCFCYWA